MARYRGIKYDYFNDKKISELSMMGRILFIGMWTECDDAGTVRANANLLRSKIFPYEDISILEIEKELVKMCLLKLIVMLKQNDQVYFWVRNFTKHQSINKVSHSRNINTNEDVIFYEPKKPLSETNLNTVITPELLQEQCSSTTVQIYYDGKKKNLICFLIDEIKRLESTIYPDPKEDPEYYQHIIDSKMGKCCPLCGRKYSLRKEDMNNTYPEIDHIDPRSKGGLHNPENLQVICARCNSQKYNTPTLLREYGKTSTDLVGPCEVPKEKREDRKEDIKEEKREEDSLNFDEFWNEYPRQVFRRKAEEAYIAAFRIIGHETLMRCVRESHSLKNDDMKFIPYAENFLEGEPWHDLSYEAKPWKRLSGIAGNDSEIDHDEAREIAERKFK
jgi:5-methylcytosine-specific restriction endonuclease McrA